MRPDTVVGSQAVLARCALSRRGLLQELPPFRDVVTSTSRRQGDPEQRGDTTASRPPGRSTASAGTKAPPPSRVTRVGAPQETPSAERARTMSFAGQPDRKRQSCQAT